MSNTNINKPNSYDEYINYTENLLKDYNFPIQKLSAGTVFGTMTRAFLKIMYEMYEYLDSYAIPNTSLKTAQGKWLDIKGEEIGVKRKVKTKTKGKLAVFKEEYNIPISISAGTYLRPKDSNKLFIVTEFFSMSETDMSPKYLTVEAEEEGPSYNLSTNTIFELNTEISNVATIVASGDWIIEKGALYESDEKYRSRIMNSWKMLGIQPTSDMYKELALSHPEVKYVDIDSNNPRGVCTVDIYVSGHDFVSNNTMLDNVAKHLKEYKCNYDDIEVLPMQTTPVDILIEIYYLKGYIKNANTTKQIKSEIFSLSGYNYLYNSAIINKVMSTSSYISNVKISGINDTFLQPGKRIYINNISVHYHKSEE